jgi:hypothetical protein
MRRAIFLAALIAVSLLTMVLQSAAQTPDSNVVGRVTNGTADAQVPEGLVITLHIFSGMESTDTYSTTVAANSGFRFSDVALEEGQTLVARTVHNGVTYVSEFVTLEQDQGEVQVPITIYEATESPVNIAIAQLHVFVDQVGDQLEVTQYCLISNMGDRTYAGQGGLASGARTTWSATLPEGADILEFESGELGGRFIPLDQGFADTRPILPGTASLEASFTYSLGYSEGRELAHAFDVPVDGVVLVLPEGDLALNGDQLSPEESLDTQMGQAFSYTAGPFGRGEPLTFAVVPRAVAGSAAQPDERPTGLVLGIVALAAAGVAVYWMWGVPAPQPMPPQVRLQIETIAALDRDYEAGRIPEKQYREERTSLKRHLSDLLSG